MTTIAAGMKKVELEVPQAKILLVDDNPDVLRSMTAVLEVLGEEILTATSANAALKHLLRCDPAVMVLDVMMPETDGFQLASVIRERERFKHTPIIFLTGLGQEDRHMLEGYKAGAVDYLLKPVDPDVLRAKVKIFVDLAKQSELLRRYADLMHANTLKLEEALGATLKAKNELEQEIQERKRAEITRDRLAGQLGATPDFVSAMAEGAVTLDSNARIIFCNSRFAEMVGKPESELLGTQISEFLADQSRIAFEALIPESSKRRAIAELELVSRHNGKISVQVSLSTFEAENMEAVAMVLTDLSEQKRNEQVLAEGRLARLILEQAHSGMLVCDGRGRIVLASKAVNHVLGSNPLFRDFDDAFDLAVVGKNSDLRKFSASEALQEQHRNVETVLRRSDGRNCNLLMNTGPIVADDGAVLGCLITLFDISERKAIEEALRRSEKLAAAGRIAGALAHEINNPLSAVTNILYILQKSETDETRQHYVDLASSELARVANIVRRTLSFYREAAHPVPVKMSEVLDHVLEVYDRQIKEKNLRITRKYKFDSEIEGYPGELRQIFGNLIANAVEVLPEGQELRLTVCSGNDLVTGKPGVRVTVADRGPGIAKKNMGRLFEPFFTTKGEKGTGLGLWVTRGIVQRQGGTIRVRSNNSPDGSWTIFSVFVPLEPRRHAELGAMAASAGQSAMAELGLEHIAGAANPMAS
jgi:PAS domain S-box-containing protein